MKGKLCVITGATSGIGQATALALGAMGANIVALGRNERAGAALVASIGQLKGGGAAEFIRADLADQRQVREAAARVCMKHKTIDVLLNNAGARYDAFRASPQGIERTFACNHLGHFLLTGLLLDSLLAAPSAQVITVSSGNHASAPIDGRWELSAQGYERRTAYARSKLANILFAVELARRLAGTHVTSNAYDPGGTASHFSRNNGLVSWVRHLLAHGLRRELVSTKTAADGIVHLVSAADTCGANGRFFHRRSEIPLPRPEITSGGRELWELSLRLTGLKLEDTGIEAWKVMRPEEETARAE